MPTKYKVIVLEPAKAEFQELLAFISKRFGKAAAVKLRLGYKSFVKSVGSFPYKHPSIPENQSVRKAVLLSRTIVYYLVEENTVTILTVIDGRRDSPEW